MIEEAIAAIWMRAETEQSEAKQALLQIAAKLSGHEDQVERAARENPGRSSRD